MFRPRTLSLAGAKRAIVAGGCLAMAYTQLTLSPATIDFSRELGASGLHVGILNALPIGLLFMQLVAALLAHRFRSRKWVWFWVSLLQRLVYLPLAAGLWLFPEASDATWVWMLIALAAVNQALLHFCNPLWLAWMGDYLPHDGLSHFWGVRHRGTQWTAAGVLMVVALVFSSGAVDIRDAFAWLTIAGVVCGVADILLFIAVEEPPPRSMEHPTVWKVLSAPFHCQDFRSFITFSCFWNFAAMIGAPFISLYLLEWVGMSLFQTLSLWTISWVGGALLSAQLGMLSERHGQRPVLILCIAFKSVTMLSLFCVPANPNVAFWLLAPIFMIDAVLNAGINIASNAFMMKNSPAENRTMFIAAGTAFAGMVGGATSIAAGGLLAMTSTWRLELFGLTIVNYHLAFGASFLLRIVAIRMATQISEANSHGARYVVSRLLGGPMAPLHSPQLYMHVFRRKTMRAKQSAATPAPHFTTEQAVTTETTMVVAEIETSANEDDAYQSRIGLSG